MASRRDAQLEGLRLYLHDRAIATANSYRERYPAEFVFAQKMANGHTLQAQ